MGPHGPPCGYSDTWQLVINTGTTIVTFMMAFLIQCTQNKDALAMRLKLNELVAAKKGASNRLLNAEDLTEEELHTLHAHYARLVELARQETTVNESHSVEEAEERHRAKVGGERWNESASPPGPAGACYEDVTCIAAALRR